VSLLLRLERRLEALAEAVFSTWGRDRVHPAEIARRVFCAMDDGAMAGVDGVMLPNAYRVFLHPRDFAPYAAISARLAAELESSLGARAAELGGRCPGPLRVTLDARDEITPGAIYVEARFSAGGDPHPVRGAPAEETRVYRRRPGAGPGLRLRVQAGPPGTAGREFTVDRPALTIGRRPDQDIVIEDPSVSRAHARIEISGGRPSVVDLGSTNGTLVNGRRAGAEPLPLRPGDRLQVGAVLLELLAEP